jgi:Domain of unknown function (DUF4156)
MCDISNNRLLIQVIGLALLLAGHSAIAETPASEPSESVLLLIGEEQDLAGCKKLGRVTGATQESDQDATYPERLIIARDNLRNETRKLGGNAVHVLQNNAGRFEVPGADKKIFFSGNAFLCE